MPEMYVSLLSLDAADCAWLELKDLYSAHRVICSLFGFHDQEKAGSEPSGIQWRSVAGTGGKMQFLILSDRRPVEPKFGRLNVKALPEDYFDQGCYHFSVRVNPTKRSWGKLLPLKTNEEIQAWFARKGGGSGFEVNSEQIAINGRRVSRFKKGSGTAVLFQVDLSGTLKVTDKELFFKTFCKGIGRGRAFGCGLMQITPIY